MTRELVGLEVDFISVDINSSYAIHNMFRNKSQITGAAEEHSLSPTQASNNTHDNEAAIPLNLHSPLWNSLLMVTLCDGSPNITKL